MTISITQKEIADMALALLGQESLSTYEENSRNGRAIRKFYSLSRIAALEDGKWSFATKRATLAPTVAAPEFDWTSKFTLPSDFLRIQHVRSSSGTNLSPDIDFTIENGELLCDKDTIRVIYTFDQTDLTKYTAKFLELFAAKLAAKACYEITQSRSEERQMNDNYRIMLVEALSGDDKGDGEPDTEETSTWLSL